MSYDLQRLRHYNGTRFSIIALLIGPAIGTLSVLLYSVVTAIGGPENQKIPEWIMRFVETLILAIPFGYVFGLPVCLVLIFLLYFERLALRSNNSLFLPVLALISSVLVGLILDVVRLGTAGLQPTSDGMSGSIVSLGVPALISSALIWLFCTTYERGSENG